MTLEHEKDKLISELDLKTEKLYRLESDFKGLQKKKLDMECLIRELEDQLE